MERPLSEVVEVVEIEPAQIRACFGDPFDGSIVELYALAQIKHLQCREVSVLWEAGACIAASEHGSGQTL